MPIKGVAAKTEQISPFAAAPFGNLPPRRINKRGAYFIY